jgi:hypothetical protein
VRRTERIVHVDVGESGERRGEFSVILLLFLLETAVLQYGYAPGRKAFKALGDFRADGFVEL